MTGHRLLRGAIRPGAVALQALPDPAQLRSIAADLAEVAELTLRNTVVHDRFAGTAVWPPTTPAPSAAWDTSPAPAACAPTPDSNIPPTALPVTEVDATTGDVLARYTVRRDEFAASAALASYLIESHTGPTEYTAAAPPIHGSPQRRRHRRRVARHHRAPRRNRRRRRITRAKVVDPSWFNWPALPVAMTDTIVPDFPLTNKSFNLSYAGNDL